MSSDDSLQELQDRDRKYALNEACEGLAKMGLLPAAFEPKDHEQVFDADAVYAALRERASARIVSVFSECIENDDDYAELLVRFAAAAGCGDRVSEIRSTCSHEDSKATISCSVDGESFAKDWPQSGDMVAPAFISFVRDTFATKLDVHVAPLPADDQYMELVFLSGDVGKETARALRRAVGESDPEADFVRGVALSIVLALFGFVATTLVGTFVIGFWISLGLSAVFWMMFIVWKIMTLGREHIKESQFQEAMEQNSPEAGQLLIEELRKAHPNEYAQGAALAKRMQNRQPKAE